MLLEMKHLTQLRMVIQHLENESKTHDFDKVTETVTLSHFKHSVAFTV